MLLVFECRNFALNVMWPGVASAAPGQQVACSVRSVLLSFLHILLILKNK
jgi:hypothetical protein